MNPVMALLAFTTAVNGLLAGLTVDATFAIVPMHRRTDSVAYVTFQRGNDCENRVVVSPLLQIRATLLTVTGSVFTSAERSSLSRRGLLLIYFFSREREVCVITRERQEEEVL
jgi:hypothetical protein